MEKFFNFYSIELCDYEERSSYYFVGPAHYTEEEFDELTKSLVTEATLISLANASNADIDTYSSISMLEIIPEICKLLELQGFKEIQPKTSTFSGGSSIGRRGCKDIKGLADHIMIHNQKIYEEYEFDEETGDRK